MSATERFAIPQERRDAVFMADRATLGFEAVERNLDGTDVTREFTTPPSPIILTRENLGQVFAYGADDWKGRWIRFFLLAYFYEGQIWYRKLDDSTFEVQVRFA